ncbi:MAG: riboflavin kinase, partial [Acidimicrobiales bacterium]
VPPGMCVPADGVYAAVHVRPNGSEHPCAVNVGRRPTFYRDAPYSLIESHLLDFVGDLYGETASVRFLAFLRSEKAFGGVDELREQLVVDIEHARRALLARGSG